MTIFEAHWTPAGARQVLNDPEVLAASLAYAESVGIPREDTLRQLENAARRERTMSERTPTPWRVHEGSGNSEQAFTITTSDQEIAKVAGNSYANRRANAAFIVRAVNAFEPLITALEAVEWGGGIVSLGDHEANCCPYCSALQHNGHAPDCQLAKALRDAKGETECR